nr:reverse transcriptase domain-containing protein [Tanacetum cinerariifolium]
MILKCVLNCFELNLCEMWFCFWDKICAYDCYVNIMCCMIVWIGGVRLSQYLYDCLDRMGTLPSICVVTGADGYAYPVLAGLLPNHEEEEQMNGLVEVEGVDDLGEENIRNVIVNGNQLGCLYKEFLACNPKEYDGKGGVVVLTRWIEKMKYVQDMSGCSIDKKVKYTAGSFV